MDGLGIWDVVRIAAGSGVVAAGINQGVQLWKDRNKHRGEARYCAVKIIAKLDTFGVACSSNVQWHYRLINEVAYYDDITKTCTMPELAWSEDNLDALQVDIASRLAWLSTEIKLARGNANDRFEHQCDPENYVIDQLNIVGYFGYEALGLADELRRAYKLPSLVSHWGLDQTKEFLKKFWDRAKERF